MRQTVKLEVVPTSQNAVNQRTMILLSFGTILSTSNVVLTEQSFQMVKCAKLNPTNGE